MAVKKLALEVLTCRFLLHYTGASFIVVLFARFLS